MMVYCPKISENDISHFSFHPIWFSSILCNIWLKFPSLLPTGYNCSLFAYGQTGSGKSYSMVGYGQNKFVLVPLLFLAYMILFFKMNFTGNYYLKIIFTGS